MIARVIELCDEDAVEHEGRLHGVESIFNQAFAFGSAAVDLHAKLQAPSQRDFRAATPFVVNAAFAIELYLKALAAKHGLTLRGHRLPRLYQALPLVALDDVSAVLPRAVHQRQYAGSPNINGTLAGLNDAFVRWRYGYEEESLSLVDPPATMLVITALHAAWVTRPVEGQQVANPRSRPTVGRGPLSHNCRPR